MRAFATCWVLLAGTGCTTALRGPETCTDIHFEATFVLARWAGWPPEDALRIAAADAWTDQHPDTNSVATERRIAGGLVNPLTIPHALFAGIGDVVFQGMAPRRAFGRRVAEATAWAAPALGHRLHFPAGGPEETVRPAFSLNPATGEIEYGNAEARRVLEAAFLEFQCHAEDLQASLALLGIGLHAIQDSYKHEGYSARSGHIGARPDPDCASGDLAGALESARATLSSLRYARRLVAGRSADPPPDWRTRLGNAFQGHEPWERTLGEEHPAREVLLDRWRRGGGEEDFERALGRVREVLR